MKLGNTRLVPHGILSENSDIRAHVSISTKSVYIYPTARGQEIARAEDQKQKAGLTSKYRKVPVYTGGIKTAEGLLVPPCDIPGCQRIHVPLDILLQANFVPEDKTGSTTPRGNKAVFVVKEMLQRGLIPVTLEVSEVTEQDLQISGTDIIVKAKARIQVKCDWSAGPRELGGSGNLFLQVAECNPNGWH